MALVSAAPYEHEVLPGEGSWGQGGGEYAQAYHHHEEKDHYPRYKFDYGVKDPHTGDHKTHWEHRDGDKVEGEYTLDEADGTKRVVSYHADDKTGFHAEVKRIGHAHHDAPKKQEYAHEYHHSGDSHSQLFVPSHQY